MQHGQLLIAWNPGSRAIGLLRDTAWEVACPLELHIKEIEHMRDTAWVVECPLLLHQLSVRYRVTA